MTNTNINKRRITKNVMFLYAKVITNITLGLFTTRIILRELGTSDYGIYGIVAGSVAMLATLNFTMAQTTQRYMSYANGSGDKLLLKRYFNASILFHFVLGAFVLFLMEAFAFPLFNGILNIPADRVEAAKIVYQFVVVSTIFNILTVPYDATINAHEDLVYYSIVGVFESSLRFAAALSISIVVADRLIVYGLFLALISILMMIIMRIYCHRHYKECVFSPKDYVDKKTIFEMGKFAGWNFLGSFSSIVGNYGTTLLLNQFWGVIINAAKAIADQLCGMVGVFSDNLMKAFNPVLVKQEGGGNREGMIGLSMLSCRLSFLMYSFIAIPFCLEMPFILKLWLKNVPEWSILFCQLQIIRTLLEQVSNPIRTSLMASGKIKYMNIGTAVYSVLTFAILWACYRVDLAPYWHYIISIVFMVFADLLCKLYLCKRYCNLSLKEYALNVIARSFTSVLIPAIIGMAIVGSYQQGFIRTISVGFFCGVSLIMTSCIFGLKPTERNYLLSKVRTKISRPTT